MNTEKNEMNFWKEIYTRLENTASKENGEGMPNRVSARYRKLIIEPVIIFLKSYIIRGNFLKGRNGYQDSVHRAVLHFAGNASRYEAQAVKNNQNNPLDDIKQEW